jgi:hypothetical protein
LVRKVFNRGAVLYKKVTELLAGMVNIIEDILFGKIKENTAKIFPAVLLNINTVFCH